MNVYATDDSSASRVAGRVLCRRTTAYEVKWAVECPFGDCARRAIMSSTSNSSSPSTQSGGA
eukprot:3510931-Rhodomonas_salina.1